MARTVACLCACVLAVLVAGASAESRSDGAFVILSRVISGDLVQGTNFTVSYEVHNVGEAYVPAANTTPPPPRAGPRLPLFPPRDRAAIHPAAGRQVFSPLTVDP
jgi:hypothetical protein